MDDSILLTIVKMLGIIPDDETSFNDDIMPFINSAFNQLCSLGVGPDKPFRLVTGEETWTDFMSNAEDYENVKEYIYLMVKLRWDTPSSGFVVTSIQTRLAELTFYLLTQAENERIDIFHPGMIYNVGDTVIRDGVHYVRITPQEVPEKWNFSNWKPYTYKDETVPLYDISLNYFVGNRCRYEGKYYVCVVESPAGEFVADNWVEYTP